MNTERLHAIIAAVRRDLESTGLVSRLSELAAALQTLAGQPQEASYQQQVSDARAAVKQSLNASDVEAWPATWQETLTELGLRDRLGSELDAAIDRIFLSNEITPQTASTEVQQLADQVSADFTNVQNLISGFAAFGVGTEDLPSGEAEVLVTIPRAAVHESLPDLGSELRELDRILAPFEEVETGSRAPFKIRAIASSDFGIFLAAIPVVAAAIAKTVNWVLDSYLKLLQIQQAKQQLVDAGTPDVALGGIDEYANSVMQTAVNEYVDSYLNEKFGDQHDDRQNEIRVALRISMTKIANRIDEGYNFDVRVGEPEEGDTDESAVPLDPALSEAISTILEISPKLKYVNRSGVQILSLPEASEQADGDADSNN